MNRRKPAIGIAVLFVLVLSAVSAASASASETLYTCVQVEGGVTMFGPHCLSVSTGDITRYKHVEWSQSTTTFVATNANTAESTKASRSSFLKSTLLGINTEVACTAVEGSGTISNKEEIFEKEIEMFGHATGKLTFSGCVVNLPAGKGCKVKGGAITTEEITVRTRSVGLEAEVKPAKVEGKFATITIEGCSTEALNNSFPVTGSFKVQMNGATLTSTHAEVTTQNTLKIGGQKAGLDGAVTIKVHGSAGETTQPIGVT